MTLLFPGFFSQPDDYVELQKELASDLQIFDYMGLSSTPLRQLGAMINERIKNPTVAIGYSMGGRVLLEAVKNNSQKFSAVCLISTAPGLKSEMEKEQRIVSDRQWAEKVLSLPWDQLVQEWNSQGVFSGGAREPARSESSFDRKVLSETLLNWSLGLQDDHQPMILNLTTPNLWVAGANDTKFCGFLKEVNAGKKTQTRVIADSGHRIHLDQPKALAKTIVSFFGR